MAQNDPSRFYNRYTGPMTDRAEYEDLLGGKSIMGGDAQSEANMEDMLQGTGNQYSPGGVELPPMFPEPRIDPQQFIRQQLAGDVVPSGIKGAPLPQPGERYGPTGYGSMGQRSIDQFGGAKNPYLDLLNILMYPQGGQIRR